MYNYFLNREAKEDLDRIHEYGVYRFGIMQADRYYEMLLDCINKIAFKPFIFPTSLHLNKEYRYCACGVDTIF